MSPDSRIKRLALGTASVFLLVVGSLLNVPQMYLMAIAISLIPVIYWLAGLLLLRGISCERVLPPTCQRGQRARVDLCFTNTTPFSKFFIRALDGLPRWVQFDGYADDSGSIMLKLQPQEPMKLAYYIRPLVRGTQKIGPVKLTNPDLIGLSTYSRITKNVDEILVFPEVYPVSPRFFDSGLANGWMDQENASTRGAGNDFQGVRQYQTGDELRRVNWKTTARSGTLTVTEYALGHVSDLTIALDLAAGSYSGDQSLQSGLEAAVEIAASIAVACLKQNGAVRLISNGSLPVGQETLRGVEQSTMVLRALALASTTAKEPIAKTISQYAITESSATALIVITGLSPLDAELSQTLAHLRRQRAGLMPLIFWIDKESFEISRPLGQWSRPVVGQIPVTYDSEIGKNVVIRAETRLTEMFGRSIS